jgi:hypothetical protein
MTDKKDPRDSTEWALAWFALDNTMNRACHTAADAILLRNSSVKQVDAEQQIQKAVTSLWEDHRRWKQRPIIKRAEEMERNEEILSNLGLMETPIFPVDIGLISPTPSSRSPSVQSQQCESFLDYPLLHVTNDFYCNLLNHYNAIEILISLIAKPMWEVPDPHRLKRAVDICRTHAGIGIRPDSITAGRIWTIFLAGVAFAGADAYPVCPLQ